LPEVRLEEADLNEVVRECVRTAGGIDEETDNGSHPDSDVTVDFEASHSPIPVRVDAMMLKRCIDNLVRNSRQAIAGQQKKSGPVDRSERAEEQPAVSKTIQIRALETGIWAVIEVNDSGPGISQQDRKRVFDPYFTTKTEGSGLGLAIVKKVVLEHGGEIECDQSRLGGASFRIRLPLNR